MTLADETSGTGFFDNAMSESLVGECSWLRHADGSSHLLPVDRWLGTSTDASDSHFDLQVADKCCGPTLDLGCGPGRLVNILMNKGVAALGVDQSDQAVAMTRRHGGVAIRRNLFDRLPGEGRWHHALLLDGNIGIGGDPEAVLKRATELVASGGSIIVELDSELPGLWRGAARVESSITKGQWFPWARVGIEYATVLAGSVSLPFVCENVCGRTIAQLTKW